MSTTTTATSTKVRFDDIGFDVAAEVLHHVDNVVDHLALSGVSQFWRKVVQNSSASGKTLLLREGVAKKLTDERFEKLLKHAGPNLSSVVIQGAPPAFTGEALRARLRQMAEQGLPDKILTLDLRGCPGVDSSIYVDWWWYAEQQQSSRLSLSLLHVTENSPSCAEFGFYSKMKRLRAQIQKHTMYLREKEVSDAYLISEEVGGIVASCTTDEEMCTTAFSPDRSLIALSVHHVGVDGVEIWNEAFERVRTLQMSGFSLTFSSDSACLAAGDFEGNVHVWEVATWTCSHTLEGHSDWVMSVAFSPDGTRIASASADNTVRVWDAVTGACAAALEDHTDSVRSVAFSPDGTRIASGSADNTVRVWEVATWTCSHTLEGHSGPVTSVAFSPDGTRTRIASGSWDETVRLWVPDFDGRSCTSWKCVATLRVLEKVRSVAFSPDGFRLAYAATRPYQGPRLNQASIADLTVCYIRFCDEEVAEERE
jgi:hypothetical protein